MPLWAITNYAFARVVMVGAGLRLLYFAAAMCVINKSNAKRQVHKLNLYENKREKIAVSVTVPRNTTKDSRICGCLLL